MMTKRRLLTCLFVLLTLAFVTPLVAERADDSERKSKNALAEGTIDGVQVSVAYGAPQVRGRKVWGGLVPFGEVWRTGADEATTITFSHDVTIEGKKLAAGTYALFTIPTETSWTFVFNKVAKQWGAYKYDQSEDALRVNVDTAGHDMVEALTFQIDGDHVNLHWEKLVVGFQVAKG